MTPVMARASTGQAPSELSENGKKKSGSLLTYSGGGNLEEDEVRSKNSVERRHETESVTSSSEEGVKTIAGILSSADRQLEISRQFAEKLAQRWYVLCCVCVGVCMCCVWVWVCVWVSGYVCIIYFSPVTFGGWGDKY